MTATSTDPNRSSSITTENVSNSVRNAIRGRTFNDGRGRSTVIYNGNRPQSRRAKRRFNNGTVVRN